MRVERFDIAIDTGSFLVNPLAAERQVEMQVAMGVAAPLYQEITIGKGRVVQSNFDNYPILRATETPEIGVHWSARQTIRSQVSERKRLDGLLQPSAMPSSLQRASGYVPCPSKSTT